MKLWGTYKQCVLKKKKEPIVVVEDPISYVACTEGYPDNRDGIVRPFLFIRTYIPDAFYLLPRTEIHPIHPDWRRRIDVFEVPNMKKLLGIPQHPPRYIGPDGKSRQMLGIGVEYPEYITYPDGRRLRKNRSFSELDGSNAVLAARKKPNPKDVLGNWDLGSDGDKKKTAVKDLELKPWAPLNIKKSQAEISGSLVRAPPTPPIPPPPEPQTPKRNWKVSGMEIGDLKWVKKINKPPQERFRQEDFYKRTFPEAGIVRPNLRNCRSEAELRLSKPYEEIPAVPIIPLSIPYEQIPPAPPAPFQLAGSESWTRPPKKHGTKVPPANLRQQWIEAQCRTLRNQYIPPSPTKPIPPRTTPTLLKENYIEDVQKVRAEYIPNLSPGAPVYPKSTQATPTKNGSFHPRNRTPNTAMLSASVIRRPSELKSCIISSHNSLTSMQTPTNCRYPTAPTSPEVQSTWSDDSLEPPDDSNMLQESISKAKGVFKRMGSKDSKSSNENRDSDASKYTASSGYYTNTNSYICAEPDEYQNIRGRSWKFGQRCMGSRSGFDSDRTTDSDIARHHSGFSSFTSLSSKILCPAEEKKFCVPGLNIVKLVTSADARAEKRRIKKREDLKAAIRVIRRADHNYST